MEPEPDAPLNLVFDFGGVLLDWNPRYLYRKVFDGDLERAERFLAEIGFDERNLRQDAGRPFDEAIAELCAQFPQHCEHIRLYPLRYPETIAGPLHGTVDLLYELKHRHYPLHAISNWSAETFRLVRHRYEFFDLFETILISGEVGLAKPDRRIFQRLLETIHQPAETCLLIDDSARNIGAAGEMGFKTIHFRSPEQLRAELAGLGLLSPGPA
jgi:2-haloacid dehalogenase